MTSEVHDVACTVCGCVCDDLQITVNNGRIERAVGACQLAEPWLLAQNRDQPPIAEIDGHSVALETALDRAAQILSSANAPLFYGLSRSSTDAQRSAVALAERIGAVIDTTASLGHGPAILAVQQVGECTCTLGEVRNRADLVIYWGANPAVSHPRHFERYAVEPKGQFIPRGRADRTVVVVDVEETDTTRQADLFLRVERGSDFEVLWTLRSLIRGQLPDPGRHLGCPLDSLRDLVRRMTTCRFGIVFIGFGLSRSRLGHRSVEALLRLVTDLNRHTRFYVRRLRGSGNVAGADSVLAWQTGFPFSVSLARDYPRYGPGEFSANDMLSRHEADACLLIGSYGARRFSPDAMNSLNRIPTVVLDPAVEECPFAPRVLIRTGVHGVHAVGTAYRMDEVPIPLRAFLPTQLPPDADVLDAIRHRLPRPALDGAATQQRGTL